MDLAINQTTGDLDMSHGIHLVTGGEAVRQNVARRLRTILGEWFLDARVGIDYFGHVFVRNPNMMIIQSLFRRAIAGTPGVTSVEALSVTSNQTTRELTVSFRAVSDYTKIIEYKDLIL